MFNRKLLIKVLGIVLSAILIGGCGATGVESLETASDKNLQEIVDEITATADEAPVQEEAETTEAGEDAAKADTEDTTDNGSGAEADDIDYEKFYVPILDKIYDGIIGDIDYENGAQFIPTGLMEIISYGQKEELLQCVGYVIKDISGDGKPELLIVDNDYYSYTDEKQNSVVLGCFTPKDGEPYLTIDGWARNCYSWMGDGNFTYLGSGGAMNTFFGQCHLSKNGTEIEWDYFYFSDEVDGEQKYFSNTTGSGSPEESEEMNISGEDFWNLEDENIYPQLEIIAFENYKKAD